MREKDFRALLLDVYQTVSDPQMWPDVLDRITESVSGRGAIVFEWDLSGSERVLHAPLMTSGYERDLFDSYLARNYKWEAADQDIYERQLLSSDHVELIAEDILYDEESDYLARPHVLELREYGVRYRTGSLLDKDNPYRSRFSLQLSERRGPLSDEDQAFVVDLLPHVAKALDISRPVHGFGFERAALMAVIDRLEVGVCVLDHLGRIVLKNTEFERQRQAYKAFSMDRSGRLTLGDDASRKKFKDLLSGPQKHGLFGARPRKEAVMIETDEVSGALCVEMVPLHRSEFFGSDPLNGAFLISRDTTRPIRVDLDLIRDANGLTKAETEIVALLCDGLTNREIAERRSTSRSTVDYQVHQILGRCRVANRTQLVRQMCSFSLPGPAFAT